MSVDGYKNGLRLREGPRGAVWYYKFKFQGETYHGSTGESSLKAAKAFLERLRTELREDAKRYKLSRLSLPCLKSIWEDWLEANTTTFSPAHVVNVKVVWRLHLEPKLGHLPLDQITTGVVERLRAEHLKTHSRGGANSILKVLNSLLKFAIRRKLIAAKPYEVRKLRVQQKPRPVLHSSDVGKFLAEIDRSRNPNAKGIVRLMLGLGLREKEAREARWEWMNLNRATYTPGQTKGKEAVAIPLPKWLVAYMKKLPEHPPSGFIFAAEDGIPHRPGYTRKPIERAGKVVGIAHLAPHRLRATFATLHADAGTPLTHVQKMCRHKTITTTMGYIENASDSLHAAQEAVAKKIGFVKREKVAKPVAKSKASSKKTSNSRRKRA